MVAANRCFKVEFPLIILVNSFELHISNSATVSAQARYMVFSVSMKDRCSQLLTHGKLVEYQWLKFQLRIPSVMKHQVTVFDGQFVCRH